MSISQTVSSWSILCMVITLILSIGVPIALAIWGKVHYKKNFSFVPLLLGMAGFFVFQIIIRAPILQVLGQFQWFKDFAKNSFWWYAILLSFTAGLFEEPARFIVYTILKKRRSFVDGFSYGIGHGGIESILVVGSVYINNLILSMMINSGTIQKVLEATPAAAQPALTAAIGQLTSMSSTIFLAAGVERLLTVFIQIGFSLLVLRGFQTGKRWLWLGIAILAHTVVDFTAVALVKVGLSPWAIEGAIAVFAALSLIYIVMQARAWRKQNEMGQVDFYGHAG